MGKGRRGDGILLIRWRCLGMSRRMSWIRMLEGKEAVMEQITFEIYIYFLRFSNRESDNFFLFFFKTYF